ncbi:MAG: hypothetical protein Q7T01_01200, partial [bacterium]|nr:hypothetical protein [bacterium]
VKVIEIDEMGRVNLSLKAAVDAGEEFTYPPKPERPAGGLEDRAPRPSGGSGGFRRGGPPRRGGPSGGSRGGFGGPRR